MIVNLSRLGKNGTGMWQYSVKFLNALSQLKLLSAIICSSSHADYLKKYNVELILVPDWVSNTSKISKFRPVLWFFYSFWLSLRLIFMGKKDTVVSTTHHALPFITNQVITVHDIRPFAYPDSKLQKIYFHCFLPRVLQRCKEILTVSFTVRDKIAACYNYPKDNIYVVYNAIELGEFHPKQIKRDYLLAVGASWKHKNIDAFLRVSELWRDKYRFVIVCGETNYVDSLKNYVNANNLSSVVEFVHNAPYSNLIDLYSDAAALVYPSLDEGFGIPPIEALACCTPVIVSDIDVFHEVLGDVANYVNPEDVTSWANALSKLDKDDVWRQNARSRIEAYSLTNMIMMISAWANR